MSPRTTRQATQEEGGGGGGGGGGGKRGALPSDLPHAWCTASDADHATKCANGHVPASLAGRDAVFAWLHGALTQVEQGGTEWAASAAKILAAEGLWSADPKRTASKHLPELQNLARRRLRELATAWEAKYRSTGHGLAARRIHAGRWKGGKRGIENGRGCVWRP